VLKGNDDSHRPTRGRQLGGGKSILRQIGIRISDWGTRYLAAVKKRASEFRQYRRPVGGGPSSKTCPRWASHLAQLISVRTIIRLLSLFSEMCSSRTGWKKLGQPVPERNFASDEKRGNPQQMQE
jgi:hypothetical protein